MYELKRNEADDPFKTLSEWFLVYSTGSSLAYGPIHYDSVFVSYFKLAGKREMNITNDIISV
jgi:hypothetical protein